MINKDRKKENGYTMVETLVSIAIFSLLSVGIVNTFVSAVKTQSRILQNQTLMEQANYTLDYMSKALRMAITDETGACTGNIGYNYGVEANQITFLSYDKKAEEYRCRRFSFANDAINESKSTNTTFNGLQTAVPVTSSKVKVSNLSIVVTGDYIDGEGVQDNKQPKVVIMIKMGPAYQTMAADLEITVQTSISQRQLDVIVVEDAGEPGGGVCSIPACASGGGVTCTVIVDGGSLVNKFTGAGTTTWTVPTGVSSVEYLVVGGGGGGTGGAGGGGGGAGGLLEGTTSIGSAISVGITVGVGGTGGGLTPSPLSTSGGNSILVVDSTTITATGGGYGAYYYMGGGYAAASGGSGGGSSQGEPNGSGISGQGYAGGNGNFSYSGSGGGGAGGVGGDASSVGGGAGGVGHASLITGSSIYYAGGGGGGGHMIGMTGGEGGAGGGGSGSQYTGNPGTPGLDGLGGGGGGGGGQNTIVNAAGGNGGSGVVIIKYSISGCTSFE